MITQLFLEFNRQDILKGRDKKFIHHGIKTNELKDKIGSVDLYGNNWFLSQVKSGTLLFKIRSATKSDVLYDNIVKLKDYAYISDSFKFSDYDVKSTQGQQQLVTDLKQLFRNMIDNGDILVYCSDPSAVYFGYAFIDTQLGYQTKKGTENRFPVVRNSSLKGTVCKHLAVTLTFLGRPEIKNPITELLVNDLLSTQSKRRYHTVQDHWWDKYFNYI